MKALFVELPAFARYRETYLDDEELRRLQATLLANPEAGDLVQGTGGLRKLRFGDARRQKGRRGGLRVVYYYWTGGPQFWLFTLFDKDEMNDLTSQQKAILRARLKAELDARRTR
ncbi:MAG: toxin [Thermoanaerobaculia bacterium]|nr:toxin [Thermoanaerobaculia bacterium]